MSLSSFSLILGVLCYVFGFPFVFSDSKYLAWRKKFLRDEGSLRLFATVVVAIAVTTLRRQWEITPDAEGLVIFLAWVTLLKGLFIAWWPSVYSDVRGPLEKFFFGTQTMQMFSGFVMVLLGAFFTYLGLVLA